MPTASDTYVPVVDVSEHQGSVNFRTMRDRGVEGLIIRTNHATTVDKRCVDYVINARLAGWRDDQLGAYTFCNPKRASGWTSGRAFVDTVLRVFGHTNLLLMLDIEGYETESGSGPVIKGPAFAAWIREHIAAVLALAPDCRLIAYSNASFWNPWVGDRALAASLEWIVPRYPIYSAGGYAGNPVPAPDGWDEWAWRVGPAGPIAPSGATWAGWQFSAGYNRCGPLYGCQSSDLDLNIVEVSAWQRWTNTAPPPLPPIPGPVDEETQTMKIKTPGQWFELVGVDVRAIGNGNAYAGLGGNEVNLTIDEMVEVLETCRHTYGPVKAEMGARFVADWNAHRPPASTGGGGDQVVRVDVNVSGP